MTDTPGPVNTPNATARTARWPWIVLVLLLLGGAAVAWFGDVPNRYRAAEAMKAGRLALLKSDQTAALKAFREAALARPTDEAIIAQYKETQETWLDLAERRLDKLDAKAAYLAWRDLPPVESVLMEPALSLYRARTEQIETAVRETLGVSLQEAMDASAAGNYDHARQLLESVEPFAALLPDLAERRRSVDATEVAGLMEQGRSMLQSEDFAGARQILQSAARLAAGDPDYAELVASIDETEVRAALRDAAIAAGNGEYQRSRELLGRAADFKVLADMVAAAQLKLRQQAAPVIAGELAVALARDDLTGVAKALARGQDFAGWEPVQADTLLHPSDLPAFLKTLDTFGLGPVAQAAFINRLDLPLVLYCRGKFAPEVVDAYLREHLQQWSRMVGGHRRGLALVLDDEARAFGAEVDEAWRKQMLAEVVQAIQVTVAIAPPAPHRDAPVGLDGPATAAFRKALQEKLGSWPSLVAHDPAKAATVVFRGGYEGYEVTDDDYSEVTTKSVRYQSGTRQVANQRRQELVNEHNDLTERYNQVMDALNAKLDYVAQVNNNPSATEWDRSQLVYKNIEIAADRTLLNGWRSQLNALRAEGDAMPRVLNEPVYADEPYEVINHIYSVWLSWQVNAQIHGNEVGEIARWESHAEFRSQEIAGDARRGVPVRAPDPVPKARLMPGLVKDLVAEVADVEKVLEQLPELTLQSFVNFHAESDPIVQADQYSGLIYAWEAAGRPLDSRRNVIEHARNILSLPVK